MNQENKEMLAKVGKVNVVKPDDWDTNPLYEKTYESESLETSYDVEEMCKHINQTKDTELIEREYIVIKTKSGNAVCLDGNTSEDDLALWRSRV